MNGEEHIKVTSNDKVKEKKKIQQSELASGQLEKPVRAPGQEKKSVIRRSKNKSRISQGHGRLPEFCCAEKQKSLTIKLFFNE